MPTIDTEVLSSQEVADRLGYTRQHVGRLIKLGKLDGRKLGRDWVVTHESVTRYIADSQNLTLGLKPDQGRGRRMAS